MVRNLLALVRALRRWDSVVLIALLALTASGITVWVSKGGFTLEWYGAILLLLLATSLLFSALVAKDGDAARLHFRRLVTFLSPAGLLFLPLLQTQAQFIVISRPTLCCFVCGAMVALFLAQWAPRVPPFPLRVRQALDGPWPAWTLAAAWAGLFGYLTIFQWLNFSQLSSDMALYEQALYNTWQGRFLQYSCDPRFPDVLFSRFGDHFEPIVLVFLPLYRLWQTPLWLLLGQVCVVAVGAPAAAAVTRHYTKSGPAALLIAAMYLSHPGLLYAVRFDFHPTSMAVGLLLWGLALALSGRLLPSFLCFLGAMACKENIPVTVAMIGLFLAWRASDREQRRYGLLLAGFSGVWVLLAIKVIIPACSPSGEWFYGGALVDPREAMGHTENALRTYLGVRMTYLSEMLSPWTFLPLLGPLGLAVAAPELIVAMLGESPWMHRIEAHYHATVLAGMVLASAYGLLALQLMLRRQFKDLGQMRTAWRSLLVGLALASGLVASQHIATLRSFPIHPSGLDATERAELGNLLHQVPDAVPIICNDGGLSSHLARRSLLAFRIAPNILTPQVMAGYEKVDYVAASVPSSGWNEERFSRAYGLQLLGRVRQFRIWKVKHVSQSPPT